MYDKWEVDNASEAQINYIKNLMKSKDKYTLRVNLDNLCKGKASNLIQALLYDTEEKLVCEKILKNKPTPMTKEEFMKKLEERTKKKLASSKKYPKGRYKIIGNLHLWRWIDFQDKTGAQIIDYDTTGNIIHSITYEFLNELDCSILKEYGLSAERINNNSLKR